MEFKFSKRKIVFNRPLSELDRLVLKFVKVLEKQKAEYVIVSGYVAILFGRSRNTEDVDLFIKELDFKRFESLWNALFKAGFECINAANAKAAWEDYLRENLAIRFAQKGSFEPNFEVKFPKSKYNRYSLEQKIAVLLNGEKLMTSELELQIAFKLSLGSDKDFEDARHLFKVFKDYLDIGLLQSHIKELRVEKKAERILWKKTYQK